MSFGGPRGLEVRIRDGRAVVEQALGVEHELEFENLEEVHEPGSPSGDLPHWPEDPFRQVPNWTLSQELQDMLISTEPLYEDDGDYSDDDDDYDHEPTPLDPASIPQFYETIPRLEEDEDAALTCNVCFERMATDITETAMGDTTKTPEAGTTDTTADIENAIIFAASDDGAPPPEQAVMLKRCGHKFGVICLTKWLSQSNTCPMCRTILVPDHRHDAPEPPRVHAGTGTFTDNGSRYEWSVEV